MANVRAKFMKSEAGQDLVQISIIGDPNDVIVKVEPTHIERFPLEWAAYKSGETEIDYGGTPLTQVPGIDASVSIAYKLKGIHNAEMLADLSDAAALGIGMGGLTARNVAQLLITARKNNPSIQPASADAEQKRPRGRPPRALDLRDGETKPTGAVSEADIKAAEYDLAPIEE